MVKKTKKEQKKLIGLEKMTEFLEIVFNSGNIIGEKPISLMIIAPVSNGKTTLVKQFYKNEHIKPFTDVTAYGILKGYERELRERKIRHIIIPDFLNVLVRRKTSVESLIMFINSSSEEGIEESKTYGFDIKEPIPPFGWILCMTKTAYDDKKKFLDGIGFSSRFIKISYNYSIDTINAILEKIITGEKQTIPNLKVAYHKKQKDISANEDINRRIKLFANLLNKGSEAEGIRLQKLLQTLLKSSAYQRGSNKVEETDLTRIENLLEVMK